MIGLPSQHRILLQLHDVTRMRVVLHCKIRPASIVKVAIGPMFDGPQLIVADLERGCEDALAALTTRPRQSAHLSKIPHLGLRARESSPGML
jgi:hypothetical protein